MCVPRGWQEWVARRAERRIQGNVAADRQPNPPSETQLRHPETDIENPRSKRTTVVGAEVQDPRPWVREGVRCPELGHFEITHVGTAEMLPPYQVVRRDQSGAFFMACLDGHGEVLVDGRWRKLMAGQACLLPAGLQNSFRIGRSRRWSFCWVRFGSGVKSRTIFRASSPVLAAFEGAPLQAAILGLRAELQGEGLSRRNYQWIELIHDYVKAFAGSFRGDARIQRLWDVVNQRLDHPWDAKALVRESHLSFEHLRRLCLREIGRTPMSHLTHLRIQQAVRLISETDEKLTEVARRVGFANGNSFAAAFKKCTGHPPSQFRRGLAGTKVC
jgi:AraC-like DNA-binding protein